jgi:hypothetical protein
MRNRYKGQRPKSRAKAESRDAVTGPGYRRCSAGRAKPKGKK